jgi:hypothetical protein
MPFAMTARRLAIFATTCVLAWLVPTHPVRADARADVQTKLKQAMESYDLMDYDVARKLLNQAVAMAKRNRLDKDPVMAKVYVDIGIVAFAVPDQEAAKVAFLSAVQVDPKIQIDAAYKSPDIAKLLEAARVEQAGGTPGEAMTPTADCASVSGLQHSLIDSGKSGVALPVEALVGADVQASKVSLWYRGEGATDFTEVKMTRQGCKFTAAIPPAGTHGTVVHYYVAAYDTGNKVIGSKGSATSPNIVELGGASGHTGDDEDPLGGHHDAAKKPSGGDVTTTVEASSGSGAGGNNPYAIVMGGTGIGYVTGTTEGGNQVKNCCLGNSVLVLTPEVGIRFGKQLSIGLVARLGLPVDANVPGHATLAPAGLVRVRYALTDTGEGLRIIGDAGFGFIRDTIKLDNPNMGQDTDIVAQGPLLFGGGVAYIKKLSGSLAFVFDASALIGVAVTKSIGTSAPALNSGLTADLSVGLALGL